jgi:Fe-S cluster biogenesis protein NfuA
MKSMDKKQDIERIKVIIEEKNARYQRRGGEVRLAGVEDGTVRIAPAGFCWN